jgi:O-antigen ligase
MLFLAVQILRGESDARWFATALTTFGVLLACFAIVQNLSAPGMLYWVRRPLYGGAVYGLYVNRNHYAGLMEMIFPIPLVMGLRVGDAAGKRLIWLFCAIVIVGSIVLSQSRGGMLAALVEIVVLFIYIRRSHRRLALVVVAVVVLTASFVLVSERDNAVSRFGELGGRERLTIAKDGLRMFAKRPLLGWGLGTFPTLYPGFRSFYTDLWVNEAHNDFLQVLIETGTVGFAIVLAFLVLLYRTGSRHLRHWRSSHLAGLRLAALTGCTGILAHSLVDFNLHIPANAALFYVLCGIAAGAGAIDRVRSGRSDMRHRRVVGADFT